MRSTSYIHPLKYFVLFSLGIVFPAWYWWMYKLPKLQYFIGYSQAVFSSLIISSVSFFLISLSLHKIIKYPEHRSNRYVIYTIFFWYFISFFILIFFRIPYSRFFILYSFSVICIGFYFIYYFEIRRSETIHYIPIGNIGLVKLIKNVNWIRLTKPVLPQPLPRLLVADLSSDKLKPEWEKFLADCTLQGISVYNVSQMEEILSGRVKTEHLHENVLGTLKPSPVYSGLKAIFDFSFSILLIPFIILLFAIISVLIKAEDMGPVLFIQKRVGRLGKEFSIYKFRTMKIDAEKAGPSFAESDDARITKVGKILRKLRIDELPQIINILKGEMSFIGPRPEQKFFVELFEKEIPFYNYRHIVKPGISGWAQVMQGYAVAGEQTKLKIQYDFFYIKNFSLSLDILIFFKTIKTILSGFGAR